MLITTDLADESRLIVSLTEPWLSLAGSRFRVPDFTSLTSIDTSLTTPSTVPFLSLLRSMFVAPLASRIRSKPLVVLWPEAVLSSID